MRGGSVGGMESLPLFPLGTVSLPGVRLPLRVFEPRYVAMVGHLERSDDPVFGVVAIRRGQEVGQQIPELYPVGSSARLDTVVRHEGHLFVEASVERRFRIESVHETRAPYLVADVTWLDSPGDTAPDDLAWRAREAFQDLLDAVGGRVDGLPDDPDLLAASILDGLGLPLPEQQAILEAGDAAARLRAVRRLCRRETALAETLDLRSASVTPSTRLNPN